MKKHVPVSKIMKTDLITVHKGQKLSEVTAILKDNPIHHVPVVSGSKLLGMLTSSDMLRVSYASAFGQDKREEMAMLDHVLDLDAVMHTDVQVVTPKQTILEATEILAQGNFHSLPVVEDGVLVGLVTTTDILKYFLAQF